MRTIKLMADYQCSPLWENSPGRVGNISLDDLPLSKVLRIRLFDWACSFDETFNDSDPINSGFTDQGALSKFQLEGLELANLLQQELGENYSIKYKDVAGVR
jgi:hypothetical protein